MAQADSHINIESQVYDLRRAARLAQLQVCAAINELKCDDKGKIIEAPESEDVQLAIFAVNQVFHLAKELDDRFQRREGSDVRA